MTEPRWQWHEGIGWTEVADPSEYPWRDVEDEAAASGWTPVFEPVAASAGEQDHSDPWIYAGGDTDPPSVG